MKCKFSYYSLTGKSRVRKKRAGDMFARYLFVHMSVLAVHIQYSLIQFLLAAGLYRFAVLLGVGHEVFYA